MSAENAAPAAQPEAQASPEAQPVDAQSAPPVEGQPAVEGDKPAATDAQVEQAIQKVKQLKLKIDGAEIIENLPFEVTAEQAEYLKKELQMSKIAQKRMQEAAELRKAKSQQDAELNKFLDTLKSDPDFILQQLGIDTVKFAEDRLAKEVEKMQLSPEQRKIQDLEKELNAIKAQEEKAKKDKEEIQAKSLRDKYAADYEKQLMDAMSAGKLPNNPHTIQKLTDYMSIALTQGLDVSFSDLIPLFQEDQKSSVKSMVQGMSVDELLGLLSDQVVSEMIVKKMPKEKKKAPPTAQDVVETAKPKEGDVIRKQRTGSASEFFRNLGR